MEKYDVVKSVDNDFELDVRTDKVNDTFWLTQDEIAQLFGKVRSTITEYINNIFSSNELDSNTSVGISDISVMLLLAVFRIFGQKSLAVFRIFGLKSLAVFRCISYN